MFCNFVEHETWRNFADSKKNQKLLGGKTLGNHDTKVRDWVIEYITSWRNTKFEKKQWKAFEI